jgi:hypothetical protein
MRAESEASPEQRAQLAAHLIARLRGVHAPTELAPASRSTAAMYQHDLFVARPARTVTPRPTIVEPPPKAAARERYILFTVPLVKAILDGRKTVTRRLVLPPGQPRGACPFGTAGDVLCVREKWGYRDEFFDRRAGGTGPFIYAADGPPAGARVLAWRPSMHMPRAACRLLLKITATRTERLTQITPEDAAAEGCPATHRHDPIGWFRQLWDRFHADRGGGWSTDPWVWVVSFTIAGA